MKVYLDDIREAPEGWIRTYSAKETIKLLKTGNVKELSLDHDLNLLHYAGEYSREETGYDVLLWLENEVATTNFTLPKINLHTANPSARLKMEAAVKSIKRIDSRRNS